MVKNNLTPSSSPGVNSAPPQGLGAFGVGGTGGSRLGEAPTPTSGEGGMEIGVSSL